MRGGAFGRRPGASAPFGSSHALFRALSRAAPLSSASVVWWRGAPDLPAPRVCEQTVPDGA